MKITQTLSQDEREALRPVDRWLFDLDNTLYPADISFFKAISARMTLYLSEYFGLDGLSAREIQKYYYERYGTTLRGMMLFDGVDPESFLNFSHDIDYRPIPPRPDLVQAIAGLPGERFVFTNGPRNHALATLDALGFGAEFHAIQDIKDAAYEPKPAAGPYNLMVKKFALDPVRSIMFEDLPQNLTIPKAMGMKTVLVVTQEGRISTGMPLDEMPPADLEAVDWITNNLPAFLRSAI